MLWSNNEVTNDRSTNSFILSLRGLKKTVEMLLSALTEIEHKEEQFLYVCNYSCINIKITYMLRNNFIHSQSEFEDQLHTTSLHTHIYIYVCVSAGVHISMLFCAVNLYLLTNIKHNLTASQVSWWHSKWPVLTQIHWPVPFQSIQVLHSRSPVTCLLICKTRENMLYQYPNMTRKHVHPISCSCS